MQSSASFSNSFALWSDKWEYGQGHYTLSGINLLATFQNRLGMERAVMRTSTTKIPIGCSLHIFKDGIPPLYDHPRNSSGGHFKLQAVTVNAADDSWAAFTELLVTDAFPHHLHVNGITFMKKQHASGLKIWICNSLNKELVADVKKFVQDQLPPQQFINFKFCPHKYILQTLFKQSKSSAGDVPNRKNRGFQPVEDNSTSDWQESPAIIFDSTSSEAFPELRSRSRSSIHSDSESVGNTSDNSLQSPCTESLNKFVTQAQWIYNDHTGPHDPYSQQEHSPTAALHVEEVDPTHHWQHDPHAFPTSLTPLERIRHKFIERHANCPMPETPVAYMSELLLFELAVHDCYCFPGDFW